MARGKTGKAGSKNVFENSTTESGDGLTRENAFNRWVTVEVSEFLLILILLIIFVLRELLVTNPQHCALEALRSALWIDNHPELTAIVKD